MLNVGVEPEAAARTQVLSSPEQRGQERSEKEVSGHSARLLIVDQSSRVESPTSTGMQPLELGTVLKLGGYQVHSVASKSEAREALTRTPPDLLIVAVSGDRNGATGTEVVDLCTAAQDLGIPVLDVLESGADLGQAVGACKADDWVLRDASADELSARLARLLGSRKSISATASRSRPAPADPRFTSLVVHDLRTPLNVIGLSFRMIEQVLPQDDPEVMEDVRFIEENFRQLERMLSQLGDYARVSEPGLSLSVSAFSPRRLVEELLESRGDRPGGQKPAVQLDVQKTCPEEAELDQVRARLAIDYALANACAAAHDGPVRLTLRGRPQRWIIEVAVDRPPPSSVESIDLRPHSYERLCGSAAERRGMDLAIAARVSELFGGTARLKAVQGEGTAIILDWPVHIASQGNL